jgi:hypothetical protein
VIDFRYHVVSIVAVFLALTVGLVLGASFLKPAALDGLHTEISSLNQDKSTLEQQQRLQDAQTSRLEQYIDETAGNLVSGQLAGETVVVVRIAGEDEASADATVALIRQAGATLSADVTVTGAFTDPADSAQLAALVTRYTPAGQSVPGGTGLERAVNLLGEALTAPGASIATVLPTPRPGMTDSEAAAMLQGFAKDGMISVTTPPTGNAADGPDVAFIAAPSAANTDAQNNAYVQLAQDLRASAVSPVIGGPAGAVAAGGLIDAVLKSPTATKEISTVDDFDQTIGRVAVVFAAFQAASGGTGVGHYGTTGATDGLLPKLPELPIPATD